MRDRNSTLRSFSVGLILLLFFLSLPGCSFLAASDLSKDQPITSDSDGAVGPTPNTLESGRVIGRVLTLNGVPIQGAVVIVPEGTAPVPEMSKLTDVSGEYVWVLPPGSFQVAVYKDGYTPQRADVTIKAGQTITLNFTLITN